ncbi:hypothetical protein BMW22_15530 [Rhizobium leguminosarum]|uniref:Uncharacterized protein n=1 Tax=Rhizobium leguminosarum TaxID=384 RepID=A0A1L3ZAX5_RHILE|nr:hypothetical protein [Rhizobium leguminosarum]API52836.1 hypothetical protein BMW22_15530 [Rhizobium leguminosarum]
MNEFDILRSPLALVAHRQIHSDAGGATVFCVVLADGFIVECGSDGYSEKRASLLAEAVNGSGPEKFLMARKSA